MAETLSSSLERVALASDPASLGAVLADVTTDLVGWGSFGYGAFDGILDEHHWLARSRELPEATLLRNLPGMALALERELAGISAAPAAPSFDLARAWPREVLERSDIFQQYWRPLRMERQLVGLMEDGQGAGGVLCVTRSAREPPFTASELRTFDLLRDRAAAALRGLRALGGDRLGEVMRALTCALPMAAFLFDARGRLRWLSDDGAARLGSEAQRTGSFTIVRSNPMMEALGVVAAARLAGLAAAGAGAGPPPTSPDPGLGWLGPGEELVVRLFDEAPEPLALLGILRRSPEAAKPGPGGAESSAELGPAQREVARLAADGRQVTGIAAELGVSESTVRTHLRRLYLRYGVHNRAQLARVLRGQ